LADASAPPPDAGGEASASAANQTFSDTCLTTEPPGRSVRTLTANNAAELGGATLGSRNVIPGFLRRPVTITVREPSIRLTVGPAFVVRSSESSRYLSLIASVTNPGNDYFCFLEATDMRWLAADGRQLLKSDRSFLQGSVGEANGLYTDTCLGAGDLGYLFEIEAGESVFAGVSSIELAFASSSPGSPVSGALLPTQYVACKDGRQFEVALESRGPAAVGLWDDAVGTYFLLDEDGPVEWGYLRTRRGLGVYAPGKVTVGGAANFYPGAIQRIHVYTAFDDPAGF